MKRTIGFLRNKTSTLLTFICATVFCLILSEEDLLKRYAPRKDCMYGDVALMSAHVISDLVMTISSVFIAVAMYFIYKDFKKRQLPWKGFLWMFAGYFFLGGTLHLIAAMDIFVTYYWIEAIFKIMTALFKSAVAFALFHSYKQLRQLKSPIEYAILATELKESKALAAELRKLLDESLNPKDPQY